MLKDKLCWIFSLSDQWKKGVLQPIICLSDGSVMILMQRIEEMLKWIMIPLYIIIFWRKKMIVRHNTHKICLTLGGLSLKQKM